MINWRYLVIYLSLVVGLILMILPLPDWVQAYRPNWVALILIYWSMALPKRVGLWFALFTGLLVDTLHGALLGMDATSVKNGYFSYLSTYKILIFVTALIPYLALKLL